MESNCRPGDEAVEDETQSELPLVIEVLDTMVSAQLEKYPYYVSPPGWHYSRAYAS